MLRYVWILAAGTIVTGASIDPGPASTQKRVLTKDWCDQFLPRTRDEDTCLDRARAANDGLAANAQAPGGGPPGGGPPGGGPPGGGPPGGGPPGGGPPGGGPPD